MALAARATSEPMAPVPTMPTFMAAPTRGSGLSAAAGARSAHEDRGRQREEGGGMRPGTLRRFQLPQAPRPAPDMMQMPVPEAVTRVSDSALHAPRAAHAAAAPTQ